jgi:hypothetical protein
MSACGPRAAGLAGKAKKAHAVTLTVTLIYPIGLLPLAIPFTRRTELSFGEVRYPLL